MPRGAALLEVDGLVMRYTTRSGAVSAVEGVSFALRAGEALGLVGESGCGKTSIALAVLRLLPDNGVISAGEIRLGGEDLLALSEEQMRRRRWRDIAMVFQAAMSAWNPVYRVGAQIKEALDLHGPRLSRAQARERIAELFALVDLDPALMDRYPHELSGGMRQRAVIAMALSCDPRVIIADEPTTALDVIVQDRILGALKRIQRDLGSSIVCISHDIAVIAEVSDQIGVMYAGRLVELGRPPPSSPGRATPTAGCCCRPRPASPAPAGGSRRWRGSRPTCSIPPPAAVSTRAARWRPASAPLRRRPCCPSPAPPIRQWRAGTGSGSPRSAPTFWPDDAAAGAGRGAGETVPDPQGALPPPDPLRARRRRGGPGHLGGREPGAGRRVGLW